MMAKTFLMVNEKHFWSIIFATVVLISWSSAEKKKLYQTPNNHWGWIQKSNDVPGVFQVSIFLFLFLSFLTALLPVNDD